MSPETAAWLELACLGKYTDEEKYPEIKVNGFDIDSPEIFTDVLIYNDEKMSAPSIDSLWDLTNEEWRGLFIFPDPQKLSEFIEVLAAIVAHPREMEAVMLPVGRITQETRS